jgi:murein DD-endopeptidase MepM/ murein hydrolase activator NlpD
MPIELNPTQKQDLFTIWNIAAKRGLTPQQQRELGAIAYAESTLRRQAVNKSSGAAGLFQLLSSGYRTKAQQYGGLFDPRANTLAIINDYVNYWKQHPNAEPGAAGRDVERSGAGADFYAQPLAGVSRYYSEWGQDPNVTKEIADYTGHANALEKQFQAVGNAPQLSRQQEANIGRIVQQAMPASRGLSLISGLGELSQKMRDMDTGPSLARQMGVQQRQEQLRGILETNELARMKAMMPKQQVPGAPGSDIAGPPAPSQGTLGVFPKGTGSQFATVDAEGAPDRTGQRHHAAYDWMLGPDKGVPALGSGVVVEAKPSSGNSGQVFGGTVKIQMADGRVIVYRHVNPGVKVGQKVQAGQQVAAVTRWADNPGSSHTHLELWKTLGGGYHYENMLDPTQVFGK